MRYINTQIWGDLHCSSNIYKYNFAKIGSIQLGDFCLEGYKKMTFDKLNGPRFFVEGNHDYFPELNCNAIAPYNVSEQGTLFHIPRGYVSGKTMFIGGADSVDKHVRTIGLDYWTEEAISQAQFERIRKIDSNVEVIISHECPQFVRKKFFGITDKQPTSIAFELLFNHFNPKMWIFAHHHRLAEDTFDGCKFICLPSGFNRSFDLPLGNLFENIFNK